MKNEFKKGSRLLTSGDYSNVFTDVDVKIASKYLLVLGKHKEKDSSRLGVVVAKKNIKHAVDRNRVKRVVREGFRESSENIKNLDLVVLARRGADKLDIKELRSILDSQLLKLRCDSDAKLEK